MTARRPAHSLTVPLALMGLAAGLVTVLGVDFVHGLDRHGLLLATRYTARVSFVFFMAVYLARPLAEATQAALPIAMLRQRRGLGVSFAMAHSVHLAALLAYFTLTTAKAPLVIALIGGFGYVLLLLMALTSNTPAQRALGARWKALHTVGLHTLWTIFTLTLALQLLNHAADPAQRAVMLSVSLAGLGLRFSLAARRLQAAAA